MDPREKYNASHVTRTLRYGCGFGGLDIRSRARASEFRPKSNRHDTPPTFLSICGRRFYASSTLRKLDDPLFPLPLLSLSFSFGLPLALSRITLFRLPPSPSLSLSLSLSPSLVAQVLARRKSEPACRDPHHENEFLVHLFLLFLYQQQLSSASSFTSALTSPHPRNPFLSHPSSPTGLRREEKKETKWRGEKESQ